MPAPRIFNNIYTRLSWVTILKRLRKKAKRSNVTPAAPMMSERLIINDLIHECNGPIRQDMI